MNTRVLVARRLCDLSQADLAEQVGINRGDISLIESQGWMPPADVQEKLATALRRTVEELFGQATDVTT